MARLSTRRTQTRGFTLIEILLSLLFLSLGIMGVIAFFSLGAADSREAVRMTRATMIGKEVRQGLVHAFRYPVYVDARGTGEADYPVYRFELPTVRASAGGEAPTTDPQAVWEIPEYQTLRQWDQINGFYFVIDDSSSRVPQSFSDATIDVLDAEGDPADAVLDLPRQAAPTPDGALMNEVYTWEYRDGFKRSAFPEVSIYNEDDSQLYSFRILIRRGPSASGDPGGMLDPGDVLCVTVYVFRQFDPAQVDTPGFEWDDYDDQTGQANYSTLSGPVPGIQPLATFHFYIGSS